MRRLREIKKAHPRTIVWTVARQKRRAKGRPHSVSGRGESRGKGDGGRGGASSNPGLLVWGGLRIQGEIVGKTKEQVKGKGPVGDDANIRYG